MKVILLVQAPVLPIPRVERDQAGTGAKLGDIEGQLTFGTLDDRQFDRSAIERQVAFRVITSVSQAVRSCHRSRRIQLVYSTPHPAEGE